MSGKVCFFGKHNKKVAGEEKVPWEKLSIRTMALRKISRSVENVSLGTFLNRAKLQDGYDGCMHFKQPSKKLPSASGKCEHEFALFFCLFGLEVNDYKETL